MLRIFFKYNRKLLSELWRKSWLRGKTVRMVSYPGAPHFPSLWEQRRNVFEEIAAWLAKYNR